VKTQTLKFLRKAFQHDLVPVKVARHNMRAWVRSVRLLDDKWLLAAPMEKRNA
jgi:hypothetical protein